MRDEGSVLDRWKERAVAALALAALVTYALRFALSPASGDAGLAAARNAPRDEDQRYVRASDGLALPADAEAVFATEEPDAYFDAEARRVWVEAKAVEVRSVLRLDPPPATVPAPPMLLPVPGPTLGFTSGLRRWPQMPPVAAAEERPTEAEAEAAREKPAAARGPGRAKQKRPREGRPAGRERRGEGKGRRDPAERSERLRRLEERLKGRGTEEESE